jgi:hypothetical protein
VPLHRKSHRWLSLLLVPASFGFFGCSLKTLGVRTTAEILEDGIASFEAESDLPLAREAAGSQIKLLEALHRADPGNRKVLLALTRSLGSYAFGFLEREAETDPDARNRAAALYRRGAEYGLALLGLDKGSKENAWLERLDRMDAGAVPALFWTGYCWAGAIRKSADSPAALAELPKAVAMIERVLVLQPGYHFGAPRLFMGVYYADRPRLAGGSPNRAREFFERAMDDSAGRYVMGKYLWARFGAVASQDPTLFERLLKEVIDSPETTLPEQRLSQEIARGWARSLLERKSDFFLEE